MKSEYRLCVKRRHGRVVRYPMKSLEVAMRALDQRGSARDVGNVEWWIESRNVTNWKRMKSEGQGQLL